MITLRGGRTDSHNEEAGRSRTLLCRGEGAVYALEGPHICVAHQHVVVEMRLLDRDVVAVVLLTPESRLAVVVLGNNVRVECSLLGGRIVAELALKGPFACVLCLDVSFQCALALRVVSTLGAPERSVGVG